MIDESSFPNLPGHYELTSPVDEEYNCIAHAAGVEDEWWCPFGVWPDEVGPDDTVENLRIVYSLYGFEPCDDGDPEAGFEKLAIYGDPSDGSYEHAAKLRLDGRWESKMGPEEDIAHQTLEALEGNVFGRVLLFMRRGIS